jgi:hypothetical protein
VLLFLSTSNVVRLVPPCRDHALGFHVTIRIAYQLFSPPTHLPLTRGEAILTLPMRVPHAGPLWRRPPP